MRARACSSLGDVFGPNKPVLTIGHAQFFGQRRNRLWRRCLRNATAGTVEHGFYHPKKQAHSSFSITVNAASSVGKSGWGS